MTTFLISLWLSFTLLTPAEPFILIDETGQIDSRVVQDAAEPLIEQGAVIAVFVISENTTFDRLLQKNNLLLENGQLRPEVIAIFINSNENTTEIRYGAKWRRAIGDDQQTIYQDRLAPGVMTGAYNAGIVNAFNEIHYTLEQQNQPESGSFPQVSGSLFAIFGAGMLLISFITWVFIRQHPQINFS